MAFHYRPLLYHPDLDQFVTSRELMADRSSAKRARLSSTRGDGDAEPPQAAPSHSAEGTDRNSAASEAESSAAIGLCGPPTAQRVLGGPWDGQEDTLQLQHALFASRYMNQNNHNAVVVPSNHVVVPGGAAALPLHFLSWPNARSFDPVMQPWVLPSYMGQPLVLQPHIPTFGSPPPLPLVSYAPSGLGLQQYGQNVTPAFTGSGSPYPLPNNLEYANASLIRSLTSQHQPCIDMARRVLPVAGAHQNVPPPRDEPLVTVSADEPPKTFPMALETDQATLSKYQCILRQQIEFFQASSADVRARAQGRNIPIRVRQVGIRCLHCSRMRPGYRPRGAVYFPVRLASLYQSAQNMGNNHFTSKQCSNVPDLTVEQLEQLKHSKTPPASTGGGGQRYWIQAAQQLGVFDSEEGTGLVHRKPS